MATARRKKKATKKDEEVDVYLMKNEAGFSMKEISEETGLGLPKVHSLLYRQEVEHNPELKIESKDNDNLGEELAEARRSGVRWERLMARSGLARHTIMELVAEAEGVEVDELKRAKKSEDDKPKSKPKSKAKPKTKRAKKAKKPVEVEPEDDDVEDEVIEDDFVEDEVVDDLDDDEVVDDEDEDEVPSPPKKARRK